MILDSSFKIWDLLFPERCVGCGRVGEFVCLNCQTKIRPKNYDQYERVDNLDRLMVLTYYNKVVKQLIYNLKYKSVIELSNYLSKLIDNYLAINDFEELNGFVLVPIPLHRFRFCYRGFNQAELIAKTVQKALGGRVNNRILKRVVNNKPQVGLSQKKRKQNIKGIFQYNNQELAALNQRVILVDDVCTTGSTISEAASVLRKNGVSEVWGLVIARG